MRPKSVARFLVFLLFALTWRSAMAVEMKPATAAAWDRYIHSVEARMDADVRPDRFLAVDGLPESRRREVYDQLKRGQPWIEQIAIREDGQPVNVPAAWIHHWLGVIFIPGATLPQVLAVLQDYDRHQDIYKPRIRRSKLIERNGNESKVHFQLFNKSIVTVYLNADFDVTDTQFGPSRYQIALRSTHIAEVVNPDGPNEQELPVGNDHGYLWRLNTYWQLEQKDGGVYVQNESVALTRSLPAIFAWLFNPFVKDLPRDVLLHLLTNTRDAVLKARTPPAT